MIPSTDLVYAILTGPTMLADASRMADEKWGPLRWETIVFPVLLAVALGAIWLLVRRASFESRFYNHPGRLFWQLCWAHKLDWSQRRLLRRLARAKRMESTAELFLAPDQFAANALPQELESYRDQIERLRIRLFL